MLALVMHCLTAMDGRRVEKMNDWFTKLWNDERQIAPIRAVMHPAWILAVAVLLVNDHIIKPWAFAEVLAGKASDFAGLFLFSVLLAAILGVKTRRGLWLSGAATGVVFASINTVPAIAAGFDALASTVVPFTTTVDPTDLVALVAIPAGLLFFEPAMRQTNARRARRGAEFTAISVGVLVCTATSPPPCDDCVGTINQTGQVSILNKTNELHILRVRGLRGGVQINCDLVREDPTGFLKDGAFAAPQSWFIQSGQEIPVLGFIDEFGNAEPQVGGRACGAALVESDTTADIFIVWDSDLPMKSFAFDADVPREVPADEQTVVLDADYSRSPADQMHEWRERSDCGERADLCDDSVLAPLAAIPDNARYFWRSQHETDLHFPKPSTVEGTLPGGDEMCVAPTAADGLVWEAPPSGELYVVAFDEGRDGCHELTLTPDPDDTEREPLSWWLCAPIEALQPLIPTEQKRIIITTRNERATVSQGGYRGIEISVFTLAEVGGNARLETISLTRGYRAPNQVEFEPIFHRIEGCEPIEVECGQVSLPVEVELGGYDETIRPGESISVGEVQPLDIHIVRAESRPIVDTTCTVGEAQDLIPTTVGSGGIGYLEAVVVRRNAGRE